MKQPMSVNCNISFLGGWGGVGVSHRVLGLVRIRIMSLAEILDSN